MPSFSKFLEEEGAAFMSFKIIENGKFQQEKLTDILMN
jgi:5-oxoprolinase (ATP-hydrolysing)